MPGETRTTVENLRKAIAGVLQDVHVALPGQVASFSPSTGLADVQVMVQHPVWDDDNLRTYEDLGVLPGVPVAWPRGGGMCATLPLAPGDTGLLVFCSTPIGEWRSTNQSSQPADDGRLSASYPVFIPGFSADVKAPAASCYQAGAMVLGSETGPGQVIIKASEVDIGQGATDFIALSTGVKAALDAIVAAVQAIGAAATLAGSAPLTGTALGTLFQAAIGTSGTPAATFQGSYAPAKSSLTATIGKAK